MVGIAHLLTSGLWLLIDRPVTSPLFLAVIVLAAWLGGIRIALFASVLGGIAIDYFYIPPANEFANSPHDLLRVALFVSEGAVLAWMVDRLRRATEELQSSREELRDLTKHQQSLREDEQKRISRELHDELGQSLTSLKMDVHVLKNKAYDIGADELASDAGRISENIDSTISSVRRIVSELRPGILDDFGLVAAGEWQTRQFEKAAGIRCTFTSNLDDLDLGTEKNTAVFRILQEALTNVARHADAEHVDVRLHCAERWLWLRISDDGQGFDANSGIGAKGMGIVGMRERARLINAEFGINKRVPRGTIVELKVPYDLENVG
jgi:signal transduction histidine kinase